MKSPPTEVGNATVIEYAILDDTVRPTGRTIHGVGLPPEIPRVGQWRNFPPPKILGPFAALAICKRIDDSSYWLFYCDENWNVQSDGWYESIEEAKNQAEFEYEGVSALWVRAG